MTPDLPSRLRRKRYWVLVLFLFLLLVGPYLVPLPKIQETSDPRELRFRSSKFEEIMDLEVHYIMEGEKGRGLILLHGFGASVFSWREVMEPLSLNYAVLAYDRPAFGLTERPPREEWSDENPYSGEFQVDLLMSLMEEMDVNNPVLIAHSAGAAVAVSAILDHPNEFSGLVLVDPALDSHGGLLRSLKWVPQVRRLTRLLVRSIPSWGSQMLDDSWYNSSKITDEVMDGYQRPLRAHNWDGALTEFVLAKPISGLREELGEIEIPVLLITGEDDNLVPMEDTLDLAEEFGNVEVFVVPNCGHLPHEERPEIFLQEVFDFLRAL